MKIRRSFRKKFIQYFALALPLVLLALETGHSNGFPQERKILGRGGFRAEILKKLAHPELIFVDHDWLLKNGWSKEDLTVEKILDEFAYAMPVDGEQVSTYTPDKKVFYSDFYGGDLIGYNWGSGRVVSGVNFQIKGAGPTSMIPTVQKKTDPSHADGKMVVLEGVLEAVKSQVANSELPFGSNRVIALIRTGNGERGKS